MNPFDDSETSRPKLPADALAFVAEVEARANSATKGPLDVHRFDNDGGDIRYQLQQNPSVSWYASQGAGSVITDFSDLDNPNARNDAEFAAKAWADVPALIAIVREQGARLNLKTRELMRKSSALDSEKELHRRTSQDLGFARERLAKLETAAKRVLGLLFESSACDEPCDCIDCQCIETLDALGLTE